MPILTILCVCEKFESEIWRFTHFMGFNKLLNIRSSSKWACLDTEIDFFCPDPKKLDSINYKDNNYIENESGDCHDIMTS